MLRAAASLFFYSRFYARFSAAGLARRKRGWTPFDTALGGTTWLITGASGGIGRAIAREAHARGARVLAVARNEGALRELAAACGDDPRLVPLACDLSRMAAVRALAAEVAARHAPVDVLVNNVGVLLDAHALTDEGHETAFATNLLGHFVLTEALHAAGALAAGGAVVNMSSGGMYGARLDLAALDRRAPAGHDGMAAYAQHKRAQVELARAWNAAWGGAPKVYATHPGWADTAGVRTALPWFRAALKSRLRSAEDAADTALWLGTTRPPLHPDGGIWLDRVRDDEHAFAFTRGGADAAALVAFLRRAADRAG